MMRKKYIVILSILAIIFVVEMIFDVFEVAAGYLMLLTNNLRPKVGRLWVAEKNDLEGSQSIHRIVSDSTSIGQLMIEDYQQLLYTLSTLHEITLEPSEFVRIYRTMPHGEATKLINPLVLYDLLRSNNWASTKIVQRNDQLSIYFVDGFDQILRDEYVDLKSSSDQVSEAPSRLENDGRFRDRLIKADIFWQAFDELSMMYRLQIINDPNKVIDWFSRVTWVGIAQHAENGVVTLAFELSFGSTSEVAYVQASEIAVGYLIEKINKLDDSIKLTLPSDSANTIIQSGQR
jgi:hypothetical protein